jgi:hypothetical protein
MGMPYGLDLTGACKDQVGDLGVYLDISQGRAVVAFGGEDLGKQVPSTRVASILADVRIEGILSVL